MFTTVTLDIATPADATLLANLLEFYTHDLSAAFPDVALGPDGRFGYPHLPRYWAEPDGRFAYLIRTDGHTAGFVLATRGSPAASLSVPGLPVAEDAAEFDVAEFFVLRRYRRAGVGQRAAALLWRRLPGRWTVRVGAANPDALAFWTRVVHDAAGGGPVAVTRLGGPGAAGWHVLAFDATARRDGA